MSLRRRLSSLAGLPARLVPAPVRRWWSARPRAFRKRLLVNLALVALIELALAAAHRLELPVVMSVEDWGIDRTIAFLGRRDRDRQSEPWVAFAYVDIDDATWREWGRPSVVPRDRLLTLLEWATGSDAAAVVVDVDLTSPQGQNGLAPDPADSALARFLTGYRGPVPVVLARSLEPPPDHQPDAWGRPRAAWFETAGDSLHSPVHWATVQFLEERDGIIRRWRLWEPACDGGRPIALPSVELLLAALLPLDPAGTADSPGTLRDLLARAAPPSCDPGAAPSTLRAAPERDAVLWGHPVRATHDVVTQRIVFQIPWSPGDDVLPRPSVRLPSGAVVPFFIRIRAGLVTAGAELPSASALRGRIVVIGGSHGDGRDIHETPLGRMPGAVVVANAIASFRSHGQLERAPWPLRMTAILILGLLAALAYATLHPKVATLAVGAVIVLVVAPASFLLFRASAWLDFAVPLLAIQLHELIADAEEAWQARGRATLHDPEHQR